ncbi:hypothetical protein BDQ12DRAFT_692102 [Crucibulum laeve]|uniref:Secreted protein n=1 Tax=Crucibulum laeve TaxID=68775 RepID=A0A5C3LHZ6_9AGAR|nr:hypothetical protein BDQ12DRAFT_692102 [Crucibulum laeve]
MILILAISVLTFINSSRSTARRRFAGYSASIQQSITITNFVQSSSSTIVPTIRCTPIVVHKWPPCS